METESRKQSFCILALLAVFAAGLGLAYLLVASKSRIELTEPIALPGTGVSAPLPENSEWEGMEKWRYELNNSFVLAGRLQSSRYLAAEVQWRFMQTSTEESIADVLEKVAISYSASAGNPNRISGPVPFEWIHIASNDFPGDIIFAAAALEPGKILQLRINTVSEPSYAEDLLFSLTKRVIYEPDPAAETGNQLLKIFYSQELSKLFKANTHINPPLLLKDATGKPSGYKISGAESTDHGREYPLSFRYNDYYKFGNSLSRTESRIEISPEEFEFLWITVESTLKRKIRHELSRRKDGSLLVRDMAERKPSGLLPVLCRKSCCLFMFGILHRVLMKGRCRI
jgi:hypothetical protein